MSFGPSDPPPFYDLAAPPKDKKIVKRGKRELKEGYVGKAKGMKQVLWERGWYVDGMSSVSTDPKPNIEMVLGGLPDFKNERSALQHTVEKRGHISGAISQISPRGGWRWHRVLLGDVETQVAAGAQRRDSEAPAPEHRVVYVPGNDPDPATT